MVRKQVTRSRNLVVSNYTNTVVSGEPTMMGRGQGISYFFTYVAGARKEVQVRF